MPVEKIETVGSGARSGNSITRIWMCALEDGPALWGEFVHNQQYDDGYFNRDRSSLTLGACFATASMVFTEAPTTGSSGGSSHEDGDTEYNFNTATMEKPLEAHSGYLTYWNHVLLSDDASRPIPDFYYTATNLVIPSSEFKYQWARPEDPVPDGMVVLADQKNNFKGVESWLYPAPVLSVTKYYRSRNLAAEQLQAVGMLQSPPWSGPYQSEAKYWLVTNSTVNKSGNYWICTTSYTYADMGWNEDLYSDGSEEETE